MLVVTSFSVIPHHCDIEPWLGSRRKRCWSCFGTHYIWWVNHDGFLTALYCVKSEESAEFNKVTSYGVYGDIK
jgi:hypothetical protein